jgi:hypothetical protein
MSYATKQVESGRRRSLGFTYNTRIAVFEPEETYTPGDGFTLTIPDPETDTPDATYEAVAMSPEDAADRERSGTTSEADRLFQVRDDTGQQWTDFGQSGEAATRIREVETGLVYVVESVTDRHDGRERLDCVEV